MQNKSRLFLSTITALILIFSHTLPVSSLVDIRKKPPIPTIPTLIPTTIPDTPSLVGREDLLSNNGKLLAYTIKPQNSWVNEDIVIKNLETNTSATIKLKLPMSFHLASWSPNDSYLYIFEEAQYYGGLRGIVLDIQTQKTLYSFPTLNRDISWVNDSEILYFEPENQCVNSLDCENPKISLKQHNLRSNTNKALFSKTQKNRKLPLIKFPTRLNKRFEFGITEDPLDYTSDVTDAIEINLDTGKSKKLNKDQLLVNTIKKSLPANHNNAEIISIESSIKLDKPYKIKIRNHNNAEETIYLSQNTKNP